MTNKDFVNSKPVDRFHKDYVMTKGEKIYALFCTYVLTFSGVFVLIRWMLEIAAE